MLHDCFFYRQVAPVLILNPPSPVDAVMSEKRKIVVGSIVRRSSSEVVEEMAALAVAEKERMTAPPPPKPIYLGRFMYSQRRPRPLRRAINPAPPAFQVAAVGATRDRDAREDYLLQEAAELACRPRTPTPPREQDDYYDLARWSIRRWK